MKGSAEKFWRTGNWYIMKTIFKTKHAQEIDYENQMAHCVTASVANVEEAVLVKQADS